MSRSQIHYVLLFLWLFAIFATPIISFLGEENNSIVTINLNEEEQQEQAKKNIDEKLIVEKKGSDFSLQSHLQGCLSYDFYIFGNSEHISEIVLPPPEQFI